MSYFSIKFNRNLDGGEFPYAIMSNWVINCYNRKFERTWKISERLKWKNVICHKNNDNIYSKKVYEVFVSKHNNYH
jgi:hypothetical protein